MSRTTFILVIAALFHLPASAMAQPAGEDAPKLCEAAKASVAADALQKMLADAAGATDERKKKLDEARKAHATAAETLIVDVGTYYLDLVRQAEKARQTVVATNQELTAVNARMGSASSDEFRRLSAERDEKRQAFEAAKAAYDEAAKPRDALQSAMENARGGSPLAEAAALTSALGTWDVLSLSGPITDVETTKTLLERAEGAVTAAEEDHDCVGKRLAAIEELEKAAASVQPSLLASLGDEMKAKRQEIQVRKKAVTDAWAASGQIDGGPNVPPLIDAYIQTITDYIEIGGRFEEAVGKLQSSGGAVEPWMGEMITHYKGANAELAQWQAQRR